MLDLSVFDRSNFERRLVAIPCDLLSTMIENLEEMDWVAGQIPIFRANESAKNISLTGPSEIFTTNEFHQPKHHATGTPKKVDTDSED